MNTGNGFSQTTRFLNPGDYFFGNAAGKVKTLLGSCVAIVLWHPNRRILAVTHHLLPMAPPGSGLTLATGAGRYIDSGIACLLRDMAAAGTQSHEYRKALYGGGIISPQPLTRQAASRSVGARNVQYVLDQAEALNWTFEVVDTGGPYPRRLVVDGISGHVSCFSIRSPSEEARA